MCEIKLNRKYDYSSDVQLVVACNGHELRSNPLIKKKFE